MSPWADEFVMLPVSRCWSIYPQGEQVMLPMIFSRAPVGRQRPSTKHNQPQRRAVRGPAAATAVATTTSMTLSAKHILYYCTYSTYCTYLQILHIWHIYMCSRFRLGWKSIMCDCAAVQCPEAAHTKCFKQRLKPFCTRLIPEYAKKYARK